MRHLVACDLPLPLTWLCALSRWLLENVFPESPLTDMSDILARGMVKNKGKNACLDTTYRTSPGSKPHLKHCSASRSQQ